jgi:hypothetical protein
MKTVSNNQFGLIVAYLLPGFIGLAGIAPFVPTVTAWLHSGSQAEASLGPPLYAILAAMTVGMVTSCFRWLIIDRLLGWTGVVQPIWDDSRLEQHLAAFHYLVESHYRYYQFVANTLVAVVWAYAVNRALRTSPVLGIGADLGVFVLCVTLFAAARDALTKYYARTDRLIGRTEHRNTKQRNRTMYNGNHHQEEAGQGKRVSDPKPQNEPKPAAKPEETKKAEQPRK